MTSRVTKELPKRETQTRPTFPEDLAYDDRCKWAQVGEHSTDAGALTKGGRDQGIISKRLQRVFLPGEGKTRLQNRGVTRWDQCMSSTELLFSPETEQLLKELQELQ